VADNLNANRKNLRRPAFVGRPSFDPLGPVVNDRSTPADRWESFSHLLIA
jgi:hypothetical protein